MIKDTLVFGDIVPFVYGNNEIDLTTFITNITALGLTKDDTLRVGIHSMGGCTTTAFSMYNYLRRLVNNGEVKGVITRVEGYCASSGVIVLLAGDERVGNDFADPFVHKAWAYLDNGDSAELKKIAEELDRTDDLIATLYSNVTSMSKEQALALMTSATWVKASECMTYGFYTKLENVQGASASQDVFNSLRKDRGIKLTIKKENKMSNKKTVFNKLKDLMKSFQNKIVKDAAGVDVDFSELEDGDTPSVGDVATIDGKPAGEYNDGTVTLADGTVYKFTGEELTEIIEAVVIENSDDTDKDAEIAELKKKIEELTTSNKAQETTFNSLKVKSNKLRTERNEAMEVLSKLNSIKDDQLKAILDGEEADDDDDDDDDDFPKEVKPRVNNKVVVKNKPSDTASILAEMNLNLFQANRK